MSARGRTVKPQPRAPSGPLGEVGVEGDAEELALEVDGVGPVVDGIVQHAVDLGEDRIVNGRAKIRDRV